MAMKIFIDVREPEEFAGGHVEGAINIPLSSILTGSPELSHMPRNAELILYCRTGNRSNTAIQMLHSAGYTNLTNGINQDTVEEHYMH